MHPVLERRRRSEQNPTVVSEAVIGLIGVIAGALTTGGVQGLVARRDRTRHARVAACLVFGDLQIARATVASQLERRLPMPEEPKLERLLAAWATNRASFAAGVKPEDFHRVAAAFTSLESYVEVTKANMAADRRMLEELLDSIETGRGVTWKASGASGDAPPPVTATDLTRRQAG